MLLRLFLACLGEVGSSRAVVAYANVGVVLHARPNIGPASKTKDRGDPPTPAPRKYCLCKGYGGQAAIPPDDGRLAIGWRLY